jgi:hypothetical protein
MGKSALVREFLVRLQRSDRAVTLVGRCYERESVSFKALDSLVDALCQHLMRLPDARAAELLPRDILALARVFPVLQRVKAVSQSPPRVGESPDPRELRTARLRGAQGAAGAAGGSQVAGAAHRRPAVG